MQKKHFQPFATLSSSFTDKLEFYRQPLLDDIIISCNCITEHCNRLIAVLTRFGQHDLHLNLAKCTFAAKKVHYIGHLISEDGVSALPSKIEAIKHIPVPKTVKEVRRFLGLSGYYHCFIKDFATISAPLTKLTMKPCNKQFNWNADCEHVFAILKTYLFNLPVLVHPKFDREFLLQTNALDIASGHLISTL